MKPTLLFDLDGTLTNSKLGIVRCFRYAMEKAGEPIPAAEELGFVLGPPLSSSFRRLGIAEPRIEELIRLYRERYVAIGMSENEMYPGVVEMLTTLARDHRLFVATSKAAVYAKKIIEDFDLARFFVGVYGSEMDGTRSNKGELIRWIIRSEGLLAGACVMIGDRSHDIVGARACDMNALGVLWGYGSRTELEEAGADTVVETPGHLARMFVG